MRAMRCLVQRHGRSVVEVCSVVIALKHSKGRQEYCFVEEMAGVVGRNFPYSHLEV